MIDTIFGTIERMATGVKAWLDLDFYEAAIVVIFVSFALVVYRLHRTDDSTFRFEDFFTHGDAQGKASVFRLLVFGAWMVHSWVIVRQEAYRHLSEASLAAYAGIWSGSYLVLRGFQMKGNADGQGQAGEGSAGAGGKREGGAVEGTR